jgi:hypothetical protein
VTRDPVTFAEVWKSNEDLELIGNHASDWDKYTAELNRVGVTLHEDVKDTLLWTGGNSSGNLTVKNYYDAIISTQELPIWHIGR